MTPFPRPGGPLVPGAWAVYWRDRRTPSYVRASSAEAAIATAKAHMPHRRARGAYARPATAGELAMSEINQ